MRRGRRTMVYVGKGARVHCWLAVANLLACGWAVTRLVAGGGASWVVLALCCAGSAALAWGRR
jgi:hypothetical protein